MSDHSSQAIDIDLSEIAAIVWAHKSLILFVTIISIFIGGYYVFSADKKFSSKAIFQIEEGLDSGFNLPGEMGAIASIAGLGSVKNNNAEVLLERIMAREFILNVSKKSSLFDDPYFNNYNPNQLDPIWKSTVKKIIGWQSTKAEKQSIIENMIISNYKKFVSADSTESGTISITVTHENPNLAAQYANNFMEEVSRFVVSESNKAQELRLSYLSETLADALQEVENAQQNLKEYAFQNSTNAQVNFISGSVKLDEIRMEKRKAQEISKVLSIIEDLIKTGNFNDSSHEALRSTFPLIDDVDFRRILGMSETISAWNWPEIETIAAVTATLKDRVKRLDIEIKNIEENAKIYAASAEDLAKFTRDAKIAEATYTVLIEQVKSQSLAAGFKPDTFKVFEYGTPSLKPSSPKRNIILAASTVLGLFLGCGLALLNSARRGVYYTKMSIVAGAQADLTLKSRSFRKLSRKSFSKIFSHISERRVLAVDEAEVMLANKKLIYVLNCGRQPTPSGTARLLAAQSSSSGRNVILCDKTGLSEKELEGIEINDIAGLKVANFGNNLDLTTGNNGAAFFTSVSFNSTIKKLSSSYDQVFICASKDEAIMGLMALKNFNPCIVLMASLRNTQKEEIKRVISNQPIDILFYD